MNPGARIEAAIEAMARQPLIEADPMSTQPSIIDFDDGGISVRLDGKDIRVWEYRNDDEQRQKMLLAREYVEGWCDCSRHAVGSPPHD